MARGAAAYSHLTKPEDGLSQSAQYWGGLYAQQREQELGRQEREKVRNAEAKSKELSEFNERWQTDIDKFQYVNTGDATGDKVLSEGILNMRNQYADLVRRERELRLNGKTREADELMLQGKEMVSSIGKITNLRSEVEKSFVGYNQALSQGLVDTELSSDYESRLNDLLNGKYFLRYDPDKKDVVAVGRNEDGSGYTQYGEDILNHNFRWFRKANAGDLAESIAGRLPEKIYDSLGKEIITTHKSFDDPNNEISKAAKTLIASELSKDPDFYRSLLNFYTGVKKTDEPLTDADIELVEKALYEDVKAMYSTEHSVKEATDRANLEEKRRKNTHDMKMDEERLNLDKAAERRLSKDAENGVVYTPMSGGGIAVKTKAGAKLSLPVGEDDKGIFYQDVPVNGVTLYESNGGVKGKVSYGGKVYEVGGNQLQTIMDVKTMEQWNEYASAARYFSQAGKTAPSTSVGTQSNTNQVSVGGNTYE